MADKNKGLSLRDRIKAAQDITSELVEVKEWGCTLDMRSPTSLEASALEEWCAARAPENEDEAPQPGRYRGMKQQYIMCCAYEPGTGKQVFSESDMEWLLDKNAAVIDRLWKIAQLLVVRARPETAVALITHTSTELELGDHFRASTE